MKILFALFLLFCQNVLANEVTQFDLRRDHPESPACHYRTIDKQKVDLHNSKTISFIALRLVKDKVVTKVIFVSFDSAKPNITVTVPDVDAEMKRIADKLRSCEQQPPDGYKGK